MSNDSGANGDRPDWDTRLAQQALSILIVELLRALARGDDAGRRVADALVEFVDCAGKSKTPLGQLVDATIGELHAEALAYEFGEFESGEKSILTDALRVTAESMAADNAARGRKSRRSQELRQSIEQELLRHEEASRKHGWSYLASLTSGLGPWPPALSRRQKRRHRLNSPPATPS